MPDPVEAILQRFPGPVTLNASRKKWGRVLLVSVVFVAGSVFFLWLGEFRRPYDEMIFRISIVFFGGGVVIAAVQFIAPRYSHLMLDRDGFEWTHPFRSRHRIRWRDATSFQSWQPFGLSASRAKTVVFDDVAQQGTKLASMNISIAGRNSGIPDTYGLSADELANLMNQWRERALNE